MLINSESLYTVYTGFKAAFQKEFEGVQPQWPAIATQVQSGTEKEQYGWVGYFPRLREWVGERYIKNIGLHDYTITNKTYEATISVPREKLEDDTYGVLTPLFADMGSQAAKHRDEIIFGLLATGGDALCYDGLPFFSESHPVTALGTQSNYTPHSDAIANDAEWNVINGNGTSSTPWYLIDNSRPLKPLILQMRRDYELTSLDRLTDVNTFMRNEYMYGVSARLNGGFGFWQTAWRVDGDINRSNFEVAYTGLLNMKSDEGRPLGVKATTLICGPSNWANAYKLINVDRLMGGAANPYYKIVDVVVSPWLP